MISAERRDKKSAEMGCRPASTLKKDMFRQRHRTITKKANLLARTCGAQVYMVVLFHEQFYTYTSHKTKGWPPSEDQIVRFGASKVSN